MKNAILVLNAGSSSMKFQVFLQGEELTSIYSGLAERLAEETPYVKIKNKDGEVILQEDLAAKAGHGEALHLAIDTLEAELAKEDVKLVYVGHRVVHGGDAYTAPVEVTAEVIEGLKEIIPLAPLHNPHNIKGMEYIAANYPDLKQVACFDTSFHSTNPESIRTFALPRKFWDMGIKRYGFHGLSYEFIATKMKEVAPLARKTVVCHLGNGASMCAIDNGKSIASTMGFTALDGLPMGTRCGNIDASVALYMIEKLGMSAAEVNDVLNKQSGVLGLSGISNDLRDVEESEEPLAKLAMEYYTMSIARKVGDLATTMGGLDSIVFTAGGGENSSFVRAEVCKKLEWLGVELDAEKNNCRGVVRQISTHTSKLAVYIIPTNEELMIANSTVALLEA
jgi:acetate kinase